MLSSIRCFCGVATLVAATLSPASASAQTRDDPDRRPISPVVIDVRGAFAKYPTDPAIATFLRVTQDNIVRRSLGLVVGAHVYPIRRRVTLGLGADLLLGRGKRTLQIADDDDDELVEGPTVRASLNAFSPQLSLNFGHRGGWSYLSAGMGWMKFDTRIDEGSVLPPPTPSSPPSTPKSTSKGPKTRTIHYGGGARWFAKERLAFCFDLRFYAVSPELATATRPALARKRLIIASAGISIR